MATPANLLFSHTFDGAGYPTFAVVWPGFDFEAATGVNLSGWARPVVDGFGHGLPSRAIGSVTWRGISQKAPGVSAYRADLTAQWKNAGGAARREVMLLVRAKGPRDCLELRVRSMGTASPEMRLFKVLAGVETQLATYSGAGLSATKMNAGLTFACRVEDLTDGSGNTRVTGYVAALGASGKGTQVLDWTGDVGILAGAYTAGVGLRDLVSGDDVTVDDLEVYDLADEWNPGGPSSDPGDGWKVELAGMLYSLDDLGALAAPVSLLSVRQAYGLQGNTARLRVDGDYRLGTLVKPGLAVKVLHDGDVRFRGWLETGRISTERETQDWTAYDGYYAARQISLREDDGTAGHHFNVADDQAEEYDPERLEMTGGAVLKWIFDRYLARLRFYGAAPPDSLPYVQAELDALDFIIPDLALSGTFVAAIDTLLRYVAQRWLVWWDPEDLVWHLRDITAVAAETIECTAEWVQFTIQPDRSKAFTAVEWIGGLRERGDDIQLSLSEGSLKPAWTSTMETQYGKDKASRTLVAVHVLGSGSGVAPDKFTRDYVDVASGTLDEDDIKGWETEVGGFNRLVTNNTSTRIWLSPPYWASPPANGTLLTFSAISENAWPMVSSSGIGQGFYLFPPAEIGGCNPWGGPGADGLHQRGFCGEAKTSVATDDGSIEHGQSFLFQVKVPNQFQRDAGFCTPIVALSQKPNPYWLPGGGTPSRTISLPPGSVPNGPCTPGVENQTPLVDITINVPTQKEAAPTLRWPAGVDEFEGPAFDDWGCRQVYTINDPDFTSEDQAAGLLPALQAIHAIKKEKPFLLTVTIAAPWTNPPVEFGAAPRTSRWAGLSKRIQITSTVRPTGFEATEKLPMYGVTFDVENNQIVVECGSPSGWLEISGIDVAKGISEARVLKRALTEIKRVEDFRNRLLAKAANRVGAADAGGISGCEVRVANDQVRRVVDVQKDDSDKIENITHGAFVRQLDVSLMMGIDRQLPGNPISVPGRDGAAAQQPIGGTTLGPLVDPQIPFQGPTPGPGGSLGRYGGPIVTDAALDGKAPRELRRYGDLIFRKQEDAHGNPAGGPGMEWAAVDAHGDPVGGYAPYRQPSDLPDGLAPLSILSPGSIGHQLLAQTSELARALGRVKDDLGRIVAPGNTGDGAYPDGAPADLASMLRAPGVLGLLRPVSASFGDPGGMVFTGPMTDGVSAGLFWRVVAPEMILARVVAVDPGDGLNGGAWAFDTSGPGGSTEFLSSASFVHKEAFAGDLEETSDSVGGVVAATPSNPFGVTTEGVELGLADPGDQTECAAVLPLPSGIRGMTLSAVVAESLAGPAVGAGDEYRQIYMRYATRASAWSGITNLGIQTALVGDGSNTATGQYKNPVGSVPNGLRAISVSVGYNPTVPAGTTSVVTVLGIGIDLVIVEGGYWVRMRESLTVEDEVRHSHPAALESVGVVDVWALYFTKALSEDVSLHEDWSLDLNPPLRAFENATLEESWSFEFNGNPIDP